MTRPDWMLPGQDGLMSGSRGTSRDFRYSGRNERTYSVLCAVSVLRTLTNTAADHPSRTQNTDFMEVPARRESPVIHCMIQSSLHKSVLLPGVYTSESIHVAVILTECKPT